MRQLRKEYDWTLAEVARRTGISVGTLSKLEHGKTDLDFSSDNKLASGPDLPVTDLTHPSTGIQGRCAITMVGRGMTFEASGRVYEVLGSDVSKYQQGYLKATVVSRFFDPEMPWAA